LWPLSAAVVGFIPSPSRIQAHCYQGDRRLPPQEPPPPSPSSSLPCSAIDGFPPSTSLEQIEAPKARRCPCVRRAQLRLHLISASNSLLSDCKPHVVPRAPRRLGFWLRVGGRSHPQPSLPRLATGVQPGGQPLSDQAQSRRNIAEETRCAIPSLGTQLHPPLPECGAGKGKRVSCNVIVHPPTKRYSYVSAPLVTKKICVYCLKAMLQLKPEVSKKTWEVVKSKCSKSFAMPQPSEIHRQQQ
jgi:hypothetical protein